jgi:hypothetical protein
MPQTTQNNTRIDGNDAATPPLTVEATASQNTALQTWEVNGGGGSLDNAGAPGVPLAQMTSDGRLLVGDVVGGSTNDALIEAHRHENSTKPMRRGIHALGRIGSQLDSMVQWIVHELELRGATAINALHSTLRVRLFNFNTAPPGTSAELRALDVEVGNDITAHSGPLPQATGIQATVTNPAGKTITQAAAIRTKINNQGPITNPYAIYTDGIGATHLEDFLEMKVPSTIPNSPNSGSNLVRLYPKTDGKVYYRSAVDNVERELGALGQGVTRLEDYLEMKVPVTLPNSPAGGSDLVRIYPKTDGKLYYRNAIDNVERQLGTLVQGVTRLEDYLEMKVPATIPSSPSNGTNLVRVYPKLDGKLYYKNSIDTDEREIGAGSITLLSTTAITSNLASVALPPFPNTYRHLRIIVTGRTNAASFLTPLGMQLNGDTTAANYVTNYLNYWSGETAPAVGLITTAAGFSIFRGLTANSSQANSFGHVDMMLCNYAETGKIRNLIYQHTCYLNNSGTKSMVVGSGSGVWTNTANAVTSIVVNASGSSFIPGSRIMVYGVS